MLIKLTSRDGGMSLVETGEIVMVTGPQEGGSCIRLRAGIVVFVTETPSEINAMLEIKPWPGGASHTR